MQRLRLKMGREGDLVAFQSGKVVLPQDLPASAKAGDWVAFSRLEPAKSGRALLGWVESVLPAPAPAPRALQNLDNQIEALEALVDRRDDQGVDTYDLRQELAALKERSC